jgi:hypothetical protein
MSGSATTPKNLCPLARLCRESQIWEICFKQTLEELTVIRDFEMKEFMDNHEFLKPIRLSEQLQIECDPSIARA